MRRGERREEGKGDDKVNCKLEKGGLRRDFEREMKEREISKKKTIRNRKQCD